MKKDKSKMSAKELESINAELFNSFDPEQELWIIGGSTRYTQSSTVTYNAGHVEYDSDIDISWD